MEKRQCVPLGGGEGVGHQVVPAQLVAHVVFIVLKKSGDISSQHKSRQMRSREFQTVGRIPKSNTKFVKIDTK